MEDKVKEFRDKNPILDFLAGFYSWSWRSIGRT